MARIRPLEETIAGHALVLKASLSKRRNKQARKGLALRWKQRAKENERQQALNALKTSEEIAEGSCPLPAAAIPDQAEVQAGGDL